MREHAVGRQRYLRRSTRNLRRIFRGGISRHPERSRNGPPRCAISMSGGGGAAGEVVPTSTQGMRSLRISRTAATATQVIHAVDIGLERAQHGDVIGSLRLAIKAVEDGEVPGYVDRADGRREIDDSEPLARIAELEQTLGAEAAIKAVRDAYEVSESTVQRWRRKRRRK
jgi:hypothetical protein